MAKLTITIPDEIAPRALDALCEAWSYPEEVPDKDGNPVPNPQSRVSFVEERIKKYLRNIVTQQEIAKASEAARSAAEKAAKDLIF